MKNFAAYLFALFLVFDVSYAQAMMMQVINNDVSHVAAGSPPTIDGSATASGATTVNITTTQTNDIVVLLVTGPISNNIAVSDVAGLTWNHRGYFVNSVAIAIDVWWAYSPSTLSADTVTATNASISGRLVVFGAHGANTTTPWDVNGALPAVFDSGSIAPYSTSPTTTISTTNANCLLISSIRFDPFLSTPTGLTAPTGFSLILATGSFLDVAKQAVTAAQSSVAITYTLSSTSTDYEMWTDALQSQ